MITNIWYGHRRLVVASGLVAGLLAVLCVLAVVLRATGDSRTASRTSVVVTRGATQPAAPASDASSWDAIPPVTAASSPAYPAIATAARQDPSEYARAFVSELFTRDYRASTREQLIAWAQYEDSPLPSPNYPRADWAKVLVNSLTDLTWDQATDTPIPSVGVWLALLSNQATQSVSNVVASPDPQWEAKIAAGYEPPDPLATVRDVTLTVVQRSGAGGNDITRYEISLAVQVGTGQHGGYGMATTNNYVVKEAA